MKIFNRTLQLALVALLFTQFSCSEDNLDTNDGSNSITEEVAKIETTYKEGDVKIETAWDSSSDDKVETFADEYTLQLVADELENVGLKNMVTLKSGSNPVGVIQSGWCDPNRRLMVLMDCEDNRQKSSVSGSWYGNITKCSSGNITYNFCVVDGSLLKRNAYNYAVLDLSGNIPRGTDLVIRAFDNEDSRNGNRVTNAGNNFSGRWGNCVFGGKNIQLAFQYFPSVSRGSTTFPDFGIGDYGVFSNYNYAARGTVFSDDEDRRNANRFSAPKSQSYYSSFIGADTGNTRLYVSRANR
ncbi:MAG: hypothetical protein ACK5L5_11420 [Bacteroidales bacterium]